jgi:hypothetical protein
MSGWVKLTESCSGIYSLNQTALRIFDEITDENDKGKEISENGEDRVTIHGKHLNSDISVDVRSLHSDSE